MSDENNSFEKEIVSVAKTFFRNHPEVPPVPEVREVLASYLCENNLSPSLSNFEFSLKACRKEIEHILNSIPASRWLDEVVKPESKRRRDAEESPRQSDKPWGVSWSQFINNG